MGLSPGWVRQDQIDAGARPGTTTEESAQIKAMKKEIAELERANEILKAAPSFFAAELDRPHTLGAFIDEHRDRFGGVEPICRLLAQHGCKTAPATYCACQKPLKALPSIDDTSRPVFVDRTTTLL
ncbi:hypothetical protein GCM10020000_80140 [Streptomyces olivoverticillatus]